MIAIIFVVPPIVPVGWPSGTYQSSFQYDCPPGDNLTQGLPLPVYTMSVSYAVFKVGFIYDEQLKPPLAFEASSTIHLPCNR
ncbi:MAG TPA: hypothetical protein VE955_05970 [Candidatus Dormibacteraeota bacterium]|nr:hypothetical protein [Candidatus Dormibacteraeota bacterium]